MSGPDPKSPLPPPAKTEREQRLAKALRDNLRRRKATPASAAPADPDATKAD